MYDIHYIAMYVSLNNTIMRDYFQLKDNVLICVRSKTTRTLVFIACGSNYTAFCVYIFRNLHYLHFHIYSSYIAQ